MGGLAGASLYYNFDKNIDCLRMKMNERGRNILHLILFITYLNSILAWSPYLNVNVVSSVENKVCFVTNCVFICRVCINLCKV